MFLLRTIRLRGTCIIFNVQFLGHTYMYIQILNRENAEQKEDI